MQYPPAPPPGMPPEIPPHLRRKETPWWVLLLYIFGGITAVTVLGIVAFFGLIAFACGHH